MTLLLVQVHGVVYRLEETVRGFLTEDSMPHGKADLIIGFEPAEVLRNIDYLKKDGLAVVNTTPVKPVTASLADTGYDGTDAIEYLGKHVSCVFADGQKECEQLGSVKFLNILLLGIAAGSGYLGITKETMISQIEKRESILPKHIA